MVMDESPTLIVDVGARFGPHPSFDNFRAPIRYVLVEADPLESDRLRREFKTPTVDVVNAAVMPIRDAERPWLRRTRNAAMSSLYSRTDVSPLYRGGAERQSQPETVEEVEVPASTLDELMHRYGQPHFLKLDTEGGEFGILASSSATAGAIGVRCEVTFTEVFADGTGTEGSFSSIHELLLRYGFHLLNLDYVGRGDVYSKFVSPCSRYGQLQSTDAVWVKPIQPMLTDDTQLLDGLRGIAYLLHNGAPDLALHYLSVPNLDSRAQAVAPKLWNHLALAVATHLYTLKWEPSQSISEHQDFWEGVFGRRFPSAHLYNADPDLNPSVRSWNLRTE